jgi:hypothetical protein
VSVSESESREIVIKSSRVDAVADDLEATMSSEGQILQEINDLACAQFLESEIVVESRFSCSCYNDWVQGRRCIKRKVQFATASEEGENGFFDFSSDLKSLSTLRGCTGIVQFIGVVMDETRQRLRSYL